jgi:23S rRNA pseudouridine1911/1915/1917 synthase
MKLWTITLFTLANFVEAWLRWPAGQYVFKLHLTHEIVVPDGSSGRLDSFLSQTLKEHSRTYYGTLCDEFHVLVNNKPRGKAYKLSPKQVIQFTDTIKPLLSVLSEKIPLDILFEDEYLVCINKPSGMVVHPAVGSPNGTFVNALLGYLHRLDKGTTGVLIAAKNDVMLSKMSELFASRQIRKLYLVICIGNPGDDTISVPIGRSVKNRQQMTVDKLSGRPSTTHVKTLAFDGKLSVCLVKIDTGRTHQIRVHLQHRGTPVVGDETYGNAHWNSKLLSENGVNRPLLHSYELSFIHPTSNLLTTICAPVPKDMCDIINRMRLQATGGNCKVLNEDSQILNFPVSDIFPHEISKSIPFSGGGN